jgi:hypothetical protein
MQQNLDSEAKKSAERRTIEVIVGRKPGLGEALPENMRKIGEKVSESEVGGRSESVYAESPYSGIVYLVDVDYPGEWFYEALTGRSFWVSY